MLKDVDIAMKESDVHIVLGSHYHESTSGIAKERFDSALTTHKYICCDLSDIRKRYISLGFHLYEMDRIAYLYALGFHSLSDYAAANFGLDASMVSRCIAVYRKFCAKDGLGHNKIFLDDKYKDYSYSQLCEMVSMKNDVLKKCKPDMTVKDLRELKKKGKIGSLSDSLDQLDQLLSKSEDINFDIKKYNSLHGSARNAYMKKIAKNSSLDPIIMNLHFADGTPVPGLNGLSVDLFAFGKCIVASIPDGLKCLFKEDKTS